MNWRSRVFVGMIALLSFISCNTGEQEITEYHNPQAIYDVSDLLSGSNHDSIVIVDFRSVEEYASGHIAGAINITKQSVEDTSAVIDGIKISKAEMVKLLRQKGVDKDQHIVIYDDKMCCDAARLWWILKTYGHKKISLLNGGLHQYRQQGGELVTEVTERNPGNFTFVGKGVGLEAKRQLVASVLNKEGWTIIDSRSIEEYLGQVYSKNCKKKGRIPGSMPIDWSYGVDYHGDQKFKAVGDLSKMFAAKGITSDINVITYCRSGVRSAHTTFVLTELLGYPNVYNYDGSWLEWSGIDRLPVELKK